MKAIRSSTKEKEYDALKPSFGSRGQPPFYDPNDLHVHVWKKGKLGNEDDPKSPTYSKAKLNIRDCVYCKICHKIRGKFQSTVGDNKDIVENMMEPVIQSRPALNYEVIKPDLVEEEVPLTEEVKCKNKEVRKYKVNERLFLESEGVFNNYVKVVKD